VTTKRGVLIAILAVGIAAAAVIVYFGPRLSLERRLEKRLNALREVEHAQLSVPSAPLVGRSGDDSYARATLSFDLTRDGVSYAPMELHLSSFYFYENGECPARRRYLVGAARGQGATRIHQEEVAEIIGLQDSETSKSQKSTYGLPFKRAAIRSISMSPPLGFDGTTSLATSCWIFPNTIIC
jgi:hypothetical protein